MSASIVWLDRPCFGGHKIIDEQRGIRRQSLEGGGLWY